MCDVLSGFIYGSHTLIPGCRSPDILIPGDNDENLGILVLTGLF